MRKKKTPSAPEFKIPSILLEGDEPIRKSISGPGKKFAMGTEPETTTRVQAEELLVLCDSGRLTLMPRDPHCLYVFWDLTVEQQQTCNVAAQLQHLFVRLHLYNEVRRIVNETAVHPESRHWFVHAPDAGKAYIAELGYYDLRSQWICVVSSGPATTPPDAVSEDQTIRFAVTPESQAEPSRAPSEARPPPMGEPAVVPSQTAGDFKTSKPLKFEFQPVEPSRGFQGGWSPSQERALEEIITASTTREEWFDSLRLVEIQQKRPAHLHFPAAALEISGPSSAELILPAPQAEVVSSPFGGEGQLVEGFWFNVNAELIIYGATEPNARVTIGGRPIKLRPDGTFSYRFALPDGHYELPVRATSVTDDKRRAELRFSRSTTYSGEVGAHPQDERLRVPSPENMA